MLIEVADTYALGPFNLAFIWLKLAGDDIHKCGLAFSVGADKANVLAFEQAEGYILEDCTVSKAVA
ncbi:hypothetical protein J27TS7_24700 [Paenibacillus dendritiformis]|nr:hypothetical protein J27TS7_24700 [Paenibacillus dendritiformis]